MDEAVTALLKLLGALALYAAMAGGWLTHVFVCLELGKWGFLIAGAIAAPVAIIHGWGIWFGLW